MCADRNEKDGEKEFLLDFIELYRSLTSLWDIKSQEYSDKKKKEVENQILLKKYKERYPAATRKDVGRKINNLRSNFKREVRRLKELRKSGARIEDSYISPLWYFDALRFIQDIKTPRSNMRLMEEEPKIKKPKKQHSATDELIQVASQRLKQKRSTYRAVAEVWAMKLESMDPDQAVIAEKMINDIIYDAQLRKLNLSSTTLFGSHVSMPFSPFDPCSSNSKFELPHCARCSSNASNVVYVQAPASSPGQNLIVRQPKSSPVEEYIVADDAHQKDLPAFFSSH